MTKDEMLARIKVLEGHRNQWRNVALRLRDTLDKVDAYADYPESVAEMVREARVFFEESGE